MKYWPLSVLIACIVWLTCSSGQLAIVSDDVTISDSQKLNIIINSLSRLESKQNDLWASFTNLKHEACGCSPPPSQKSQADLPDSQPKRPVRQVASLNPTTSSTNDQLFYINKLASSENLIPSSSPDLNAEDADGDDNSSRPHQPGLEYPVYYAIEGFSRLLKEQLTSFRSSLNKLMVRVVDHGYQYQLILNKLSIIRDECSLAATLSLADKRADSLPEGEVAPRQEDASSTAANPIRASDVSLIVRLLSSELSQILDSQHLTPAARTTDFSAIVNEANGLLSDKLSGIYLNESRVLAKRLDAIDSVGKQSALMLGKLWQSPLCAAGGSDRVAVLDVSNSNDPTNGSSTPRQTIQHSARNASPDKQQQQRWFPGSRVPGRPADEQSAENVSSAFGKRHGKQTAANAAGPRKCQSKTSLVRPTSCQELRLAGANCTGQYYVFLRGNIKHVYCDMNMDSRDDGGGWTVVLRRIDKSLGNFVSAIAGEHDEQQASNQTSQSSSSSSSAGRQPNALMEAFKASQLDFRQDWPNYRTGFGQLNEWAEFFVGLDMLHQLLSGPISDSDSTAEPTETSELQIDLEFANGEQLHLKFANFSIGSDESKFELAVSGCNATEAITCAPITLLDHSRFWARENLTRAPEMVQSAAREWLLETGVGWWIPSNHSANHWLPLTLPLGASSSSGGGGGGPSANSTARHIYWPGYAQEPLRRIIMKVRAKRNSVRASSNNSATHLLKYQQQQQRE